MTSNSANWSLPRNGHGLRDVPNLTQPVSQAPWELEVLPVFVDQASAIRWLVRTPAATWRAPGRAAASPQEVMREALVVFGIGHADPTTLFDAVATQRGQTAFWTTDAVVHPSLGSIAEFGFPGAPARLKMQVDQLEPGRLVSWVCQGDFPYWTATRITWELRASPNAGETTSLFTHTGWAEDYPRDEFAHVNYVWGQIVARLKGYAETGQPQPFFAPAAARHA